MKTNNKSIVCKNKYLSFMNRAWAFISVFTVLCIFGAGLYLLIRFWIDIPVVLKILLPIVSLIIFLGEIFIPFNGMYIGKKGTVVFVPDLRIKKFRINEIKRMAFNFSEWNNKEYSVTIDIVFPNGKIFTKDYSQQFKNIRMNWCVKSVYTIKRAKVDKIIEQLSNYDFCAINVINQCGEIVYQKRGIY